ncbi:MAG: aminoglycoside phosphotransferase family protein [Nanoarchaeota archaeon]
MIQLGFNEIKNRIINIAGNVTCLKAIGNHHLKRHLVYKLNCGNKKYVFKLYHKKNRWNREVACLKFFAESKILAPQIIEYGVFDDGLEWILCEYIKGELLSKSIHNISAVNLKRIYYDIGKQLGLIHNFRDFDFFGSMDENGKSINRYTRYKDYFEKRMDIILADLYTFEHDEFDLLKKAEAKLKSMYEIVDKVNKANLCHNDYDERNIMVVENDGKYHLAAIIDFEQSVPDDIDKELIYVYLSLLEKNKNLAESFKAGYEEYGEINLERLNFKKEFYNLYKGISICAWAKKVDYDYYLQGIQIIKDIFK